MLPLAENGLVHHLATSSVAETMDDFEATLTERGIKVFCRIDHAAEAHTAGLEMRDCQLLIFGNPKAGTPLMTAAPTTAIDLPLKVLVWEDEHGKTWITMNTPEYLQLRHGFPRALMANIARAFEALMNAA